ncbi:DJ-1/PfpI family protein [Anderseniella sp. Alg231-50]|uniref:DJ-1/PfpI family protein n=1 Tax=Anderseniella sp. Alg231-50 TaxID=1922226 RepID=UPI000D561A3A
MRSIAALVFPGFETLDLFGPIEMFGMLPEEFSLSIVAEQEGEVASTHGQRACVDHTFAAAQSFDMLLVPGGPGTRAQVDNPAMMDWLTAKAAQAETIMSVCTGSALLAKAGLLDGRKATSNKMSFAWVKEQGPDVDWVARARWVEDGRLFTSSGVSAGMDMSLSVIERLHDKDTARKVARYAEYTWHEDAAHDPFAEHYGLT